MKKRQRCSACRRRFYFVANLNRHISTCLAERCRKRGKKFHKSAITMQHRDRKQNSWKCHICKRLYKTPEKLVIHFQKNHLLTDPPYVCVICRYFSDNVEQFLLHNRTIHKFKVFCSYCPYILATWDACLLHEMSNHTAIDNTKPYCPICNKSFANTDTFTKHFKNFHSSKKEWYTRIHCKAIVQDKQFRIHTRRNIFPFRCRLCNREFISLRSLDVHRCRQNIAPRQTSQRCLCNLCGRKFRDKKSIEDHMYIHKFDIIYVCQICNKTFRNHLYVQIHMKEHENSPTAKSVPSEDSANLNIVPGSLAVGRIEARSRPYTDKSKTNIDTTNENKTESDNMQTKISMAKFDKTLTGEILRNLEIVSGQMIVKHPESIYIRTGENDEIINAPTPSISIDQNRKVLEIISGSLTVKISEDISRLLTQNTENMRANTTDSFPVTIPPTTTNLEIVSDPSNVKVNGQTKPRTSKNSRAKSKAVKKSKHAKKSQSKTRSTEENTDSEVIYGKLETKSTVESQAVPTSPRNKSSAALEIVPGQSSINHQQRMIGPSIGQSTAISFNNSLGKSCSLKENSNDKLHIVSGPSNEEPTPSTSSNQRAKSKPKRKPRSFKNKKKLKVRNEEDTISVLNRENNMANDKIPFTYKCSECEKEFSPATDLKSYDCPREMAKLKPETRTKRKDKCSTCENKFITTNDLDMQDSKETTLNSGPESNLKNITRICLHCNEEFKASTDPIPHNCKETNPIAHNNEINVDYKCPVCYLNFKSLADLKSHGCKGTKDTLAPKSDTSSKDTILFSHTCVICGHICNTETDVLLHHCKIDHLHYTRTSNTPGKQEEKRITSNCQTELCTSTSCNKKFPTIVGLLSNSCPGSEKMSTGPIDNDTTNTFQTQGPQLPKLSMQKVCTDTGSDVHSNRNDSPAGPSIMKDSLKPEEAPIIHSENSSLDIIESRITPESTSIYQCTHCKRFFQNEEEAKMQECSNVRGQPPTEEIPIQNISYQVSTFPSTSYSADSKLNQEIPTCENYQWKSAETNNANVNKFLLETDPLMDAAIDTSLDILDDLMLKKMFLSFQM